MGTEIPSHHFHKTDFEKFDKRLREETGELEQWFAKRDFLTGRPKGGYELEAWITDKDCRPVPANEELIKLCNDVHVVPELAKFNLELNSEPYVLQGNALHSMHDEFTTNWNKCNEIAASIDLQLMMIGILPTAVAQELTVANMSNWKRYRALNEQVLRLREGRPLRIDIRGREHFEMTHHDVMLESAATSFQIHLKLNLDNAVRCYNAARVISAPMVALSANSPYLFGKDLWDETRIPLFEQAVSLRGYEESPCGPVRRVSFGIDYVKESMFECFKENLECYPVLLPVTIEDETEPLPHLRLHNGTIWRWNRPLIGFNERGEPHLRIEHRVVAAGPTIVDSIANAAFFYGLVSALSAQPQPPESRLSFDQARKNFYTAAQHGLDAGIIWLDGRTVLAGELLLQELLPLSRQGLNAMGIAQDDIKLYLDIIEGRLRTGQNGAVWQRAYVARHGHNMDELTMAYQECHKVGNPVHEWPVANNKKSVGRTSTMLTVLDHLPEKFLTTAAARLYEILPGPTLIHLEGRRPEPLFVSVLQHGNEDTGLLAVQSLLRDYQGRELPRSLSVFVGNVAAARYGKRHLEGQPDYNRVWNGDGTPEHAMMREIVDIMRSRGVFASVDIHNNTGANPHYACVNHIDNRFFHLATLFGRTVVYFIKPADVQSMAFGTFCPAVILECGRPGIEQGVLHARDYLDACLHLAEIPDHPVPAEDLDLYHTIAVVKIPPDVSYTFGAGDADIQFLEDIDKLNFSELPANSSLGWIREGSRARLEVMDEHGKDSGSRFFNYEGNELKTVRPVTPSMLTLDRQVIRQDCLCYLMERLQPAVLMTTGAD